MTSLWFVVPAHGREEITRVCLEELSAVCRCLAARSIEATAVVVADDTNLDVAHELGFWGVERSNEALGRKFNDGYQLAASKGADFVVPFGSDNWIDPAWILAKPLDDTVIRCMRECAVVNETADRIGWFRTPFDGGIGIRIIPTRMLHPFGYRPAVEDRNDVIDGSTLTTMKRVLGQDLKLDYQDLHSGQVVDWKSPVEQIHSWASMLNLVEDDRDPFDALADIYSPAALERMRGAYAAVLV